MCLEEIIKCQNSSPHLKYKCLPFFINSNAIWPNAWATGTAMTVLSI